VSANLDLENELFAGGARRVAGVDEVGRGCLAGPVSVGVVVLEAGVGVMPEGLTDSKLLSPTRREGFVAVIKSWASAWAVGEASAAEIDELGIITALGLAGARALGEVGRVDTIVLDGNFDWLSPEADTKDANVICRVGADKEIASVAAASVLAKVDRDGLMKDLDLVYPGYGFAQHKGYGTPGHRDAIRFQGASDQHRKTWKLL